MPSQKLRQFVRQIGLILLFAVVAMVPAFINGVPSGNDQAQHYQFAWTVFQSVKSGDFFPSYAADTNHGLGDYGIRFYPPLTYYLLAGLFAVLQDWYFASLAAFTLVFILGGAGLYLWARTEFEQPQALIAAMLYVVAPYHLNELYNTFLLAEFFATAIIPVCFLYLTKACQNRRWSDIVGLSVAFGMLILSHLPLTIICSLAMGIYAIILLNRNEVLRTLTKLAAAVTASVVLTSFYWSRWLPELAWITHSSPKYFGTIWDYRSNFLLLPGHFLNFGEDASNLWFADILLISTLLIVIPTAVYLGKDRTLFTKFLGAISIVLAVSVIMTTPVSGLVWSNLGFLQKVQFPWRFLAIITPFAAVLASFGIAKAADAMKASGRRLATVGLAVVLGVFFFTSAFTTRASVFVSREHLNGQMATIADSEGCECWWPIWAKREAFEQQDKATAGDRSVDVRKWTPKTKVFHVESGIASAMSVRTFFYPHWTATVNGQDVAAGNSESGTISIILPAEPSDVTLTFTEPRYVLYANVASGIAWIAVLAFLLIRSWRKLSAAPTHVSATDI